MKTYEVRTLKRKDDEVLNIRYFKNDEEKARRYFNLLKTDYVYRKDSYYDEDEDIKISDLKISLIEIFGEKEKELLYFTVGA